MAKIYVLPYYRKGLSNSITSSGQLKQHRATLKVNLGVELNKKIDGLNEEIKSKSKELDWYVKELDECNKWLKIKDDRIIELEGEE
jgi:hypothetical protein